MRASAAPAAGHSTRPEARNRREPLARASAVHGLASTVSRSLVAGGPLEAAVQRSKVMEVTLSSRSRADATVADSPLAAAELAPRAATAGAIALITWSNGKPSRVIAGASRASRRKLEQWNFATNRVSPAPVAGAADLGAAASCTAAACAASSKAPHAVARSQAASRHRAFSSRHARFKSFPSPAASAVLASDRHSAPGPCATGHPVKTALNHASAARTPGGVRAAGARARSRAQQARPLARHAAERPPTPAPARTSGSRSPAAARASTSPAAASGTAAGP
mmetsp:Transcript_109581/g.353688  ORF Transcript_109581/g.353688 Transcript_109581/m.353688 type:complete len:281 (-) Transcript_109581:439-1281(-)